MKGALPAICNLACDIQIWEGTQPTINLIEEVDNEITITVANYNAAAPTDFTLSIDENDFTAITTASKSGNNVYLRVALKKNALGQRSLVTGKHRPTLHINGFGNIKNTVTQTIDVSFLVSNTLAKSVSHIYLVSLIKLNCIKGQLRWPSYYFYLWSWFRIWISQTSCNKGNSKG
jgi:hypothetical protein